LESILESLKTLNQRQKERFTKMKTDYSKLQRKDVFADEEQKYFYCWRLSNLLDMKVMLQMLMNKDFFQKG